MHIYGAKPQTMFIRWVLFCSALASAWVSLLRIIILIVPIKEVAIIKIIIKQTEIVQNTSSNYNVNFQLKIKMIQK